MLINFLFPFLIFIFLNAYGGFLALKYFELWEKHFLHPFSFSKIKFSISNTVITINILVQSVFSTCWTCALIIPFQNDQDICNKIFIHLFMTRAMINSAQLKYEMTPGCNCYLQDIWSIKQYCSCLIPTSLNTIFLSEQFIWFVLRSL